ncbi:hypothetical protein ACFO5T_11520 [Dokdonia genika]|jgi:hypothetical protein|uniref:Lipoprotein n=1 Tax=Dokdonia genika TaxID=308113 RepID=A0ABV9LA84_9FLAO|nr:hypothetical protein [Dokdonia donghaensis]
MKTFKQLAVLAVLSALLISCCDCPSGAPDPQHIISENDAYQLQQTYFNNQHKYITIGVEGQYQNGEPDNVGVIVKDIDDLQKYLINIKKEAIAQGKQNPGAVIYFGAKNDENNVPRSTVFFQAMHATPDPDSEDPDFPDTDDYKKFSYPHAFYDKLDPMGKKPGDAQPVEGGSN